MWDNEISPLYDVELEPGERRSEVGGDFARRIILHQPFDYAEAVAEDFLFGFSPVKSRRDRDLPVSRWQFQEHYPVFREPDTTEILRADGYERGVADGTLARSCARTSGSSTPAARCSRSRSSSASSARSELAARAALDYARPPSCSPSPRSPSTCRAWLSASSRGATSYPCSCSCPLPARSPWPR